MISNFEQIKAQLAELATVINAFKSEAPASDCRADHLSLEDAQALVDSLASRNLPHVWQVSGKKRVLTQALDFKQQVLLLLYSDTDSGLLTEDLFSWTEYSNLAMFKKSVFGALHNKRLIEYDRETETVVISPLGTRYVDEDILPLLDG